MHAVRILASGPLHAFVLLLPAVFVPHRRPLSPPSRLYYVVRVRLFVLNVRIRSLLKVVVTIGDGSSESHNRLGPQRQTANDSNELSKTEPPEVSEKCMTGDCARGYRPPTGAHGFLLGTKDSTQHAHNILNLRRAIAGPLLLLAFYFRRVHSPCEARSELRWQTTHSYNTCPRSSFRSRVDPGRRRAGLMAQLFRAQMGRGGQLGWITQVQADD